MRAPDNRLNPVVAEEPQRHFLPQFHVLGFHQVRRVTRCGIRRRVLALVVKFSRRFVLNLTAHDERDSAVEETAFLPVGDAQPRFRVDLIPQVDEVASLTIDGSHEAYLSALSGYRALGAPLSHLSINTIYDIRIYALCQVLSAYNTLKNFCPVSTLSQRFVL